MCETAVPTVEPTVQNHIDLSRVHMVGIGGAGMLPLARVLVERGMKVSGSDDRVGTDLPASSKDNRFSPALLVLEQAGAVVQWGHSAQNIPAGTTAVVFTNAVGEENAEIVEARRLGIPLVHRSQALNKLMSDRVAVGVLGTHGKSSTAGMLAVGLTGMGLAPTYVVGGELSGPGTGGRAGKGVLFVAEIDESDRTHVGMNLDLAVITNVEHDHPENYRDVDDHIATFEHVARNVRPGGTVVVNIDSPGGLELATRIGRAELGPRLVTVGTSPEAMWRLTNSGTRHGASRADLHSPTGTVYHLLLELPGVHQVANAAGAVVAADALGVDCTRLVTELRTVAGVTRRMTRSGKTMSGAIIVDSYAHHPTEAAADIAAARSLTGPGGRVLTVFQPSGALRHNMFAGKLSRALTGADAVVVTESDRTLGEDTLRALADRVTEGGGTVMTVVADRATAVDALAGVAGPDDVLVLMGAGDLYARSRQLVVQWELLTAA